MKAPLKVDGIDVLVEGEGRESMVMIHGWPDTYRLWDRQVEYFSAHYRCVRFTLPGFDINASCKAFSLTQLIEKFRLVIEETCPDRKCILMLHDWGCVFGYQFYMQHPSLVSKIVGVDIGDAPSLRYVKSLNIKAKGMIVTYQVWLAIAWRIGGRLGSRMTQSMARALRAPSDPQYIGSSMNYPYYIQWTGTYGSYKRLAEVAPRCPMLFIYGARKPFLFHSSQWADTLAARPGCRVISFDTGHWVMHDEPQKFNETVKAWLEAT